MYTQEFRFKETVKPEHFEIRLLAIPESCLSTLADEVMLHVSLIDALPNYNSRIQLELNDVFASDQWELTQSLFQESDSVSVREFFEALMDKKMEFTIEANGNGIGFWNGAKVIKSVNQNEEKKYKLDRMDSSYLRLRKSELFVTLDREIKLVINSFTDPVSSNIKIEKENINALILKYNLTKNDILSSYRTLTILNKMKSELNLLAGKYFSREEAKIIIDRLNREINKVKINVGATSIKQSDL